MKLNYAQGVEFNEEKHEYWYKGKQLSGITGLIVKKLGMKMPAEFMEEHRIEGVHIHKSIQEWIDTGKTESVHPGVKWVMESMSRDGLNSEVLITDFKQYASAVDIVLRHKRGTLQIYDLKKGVFHRDYVSWQLGIYKYLLEKYAEQVVHACTCICLRDKEFYPIIPVSADKVEKLLYGK